MSIPAQTRVWIVEDDVQYRDTIALLLNHTSRMRCTGEFGTAEEALKSLSVGDPDPPHVVLMDINLPEMNGLEAASCLKATHPEVPIVMLTIRDDAETIYDAFRAGASGYLLKNAPIDTITASIREALTGGMLMPAPVARKVMAFFAAEKRTAPEYGLTQREKEVLQEMVQGYSQKEIADRLFISPSTVNAHIQHLYEKLHVHSSSAAVAKAIRERLV